MANGNPTYLDIIKNQTAKGGPNLEAEGDTRTPVAKSLANKPDTEGVHNIDLSKYTNIQNPFDTEFLDKQRAENQKWWQAGGNAIAQAASEVAFGTLEGLGYLFDFEQHKNILTGTEKEFGNWFSDLMKQGKELVAEEMPVYGGEGFDPLNPRWWSKNLPSIASSLSLLVPTSLATRGLAAGGRALSNVGKVGKMLKALPEGNKIASKGLSGALISRYMENTMEASETAKSEYEKLIAQGIPEEAARDRAGQAASNAWYANLANLVTDIPQYMMLFGKTNKALTKMAQQAQAKKGNFLKDLAFQMSSEGIEEGIQYGIQQEAGRSENTLETLANIIPNLGEYVEDEEFWNSVFLGAVGGGVFTTLGSAVDRLTAKKMGEPGYSDDYVKRQYERLDKYQAAKARGDEAKAQGIAQEQVIDNAINNPEKNIALADQLEDTDPTQAEDIRATQDAIDQLQFEVNQDDSIPNEIKKDVVENQAQLQNNYRTLENINNEAQQAIGELDKQFNLANPNYTPKENDTTGLSPASKAFNNVVAKVGNTYRPSDKKLGEYVRKKINSAYSLVDLPNNYPKSPAAKKVKDKATLFANELIEMHTREYKDSQLRSKKEQPKIVEQKQQEAIDKAQEARLKELDKLNPEEIYNQVQSPDTELEVKADAVGLVAEKAKDEQGDSPSAEILDYFSQGIIEGENVVNYYKNKPYSLLVDFDFKYKNIQELEAALTDKKSPEVKKEKTKRQNQQAKESVVEKSEPSEGTTRTLDLDTGEVTVVEGEVVDTLNFDEETNNVTVDNYPGSESNAYEIPTSPDNVLYQYQNGEIIPWFGKLPGQGRGKGIKLTKENYNPRTGVLTIDGKEYYLPANLSIGPKATLGEKKYNLVDASKQTVQSDYGKKYTIDRAWIDSQKENFAKLQGEKVQLIIYPHEYNQEQVGKSGKLASYNGPNPQVAVVYDGHVIGVLQSPHKFAKKEYKELWNNIWEQYKANPNQEAVYPIEVPIKKILGGYINDQKLRNKPSEVLSEGQEYKLAIVYKIPDAKDGSKVLWIDEDTWIDAPSNAQDGDVYLLSKNFNNQEVPIRLFTKKVKNSKNIKGESLSSKLLKAINKFDEIAARNIVRFSIEKDDGAKGLAPGFNDKLSERFGKVKIFLANGKDFRKYKSKFNGLYDLKKETTTLDTLKAGAIIATKSKEQGKLYDQIYGIVTQKVTGDPNQVIKLQPLDENLERNGDPVELPLSDLTNFYLHYAYHYSEFYDLMNRRAQIDKTKLNQAKYNQNIADNRLESDLVPGKHFNSPNVILDFDSVFEQPIVSKPDTKVETPTEVNAKEEVKSEEPKTSEEVQERKKPTNRFAKRVGKDDPNIKELIIPINGIPSVFYFDNKVKKLKSPIDYYIGKTYKVFKKTKSGDLNIIEAEVIRTEYKKYYTADEAINESYGVTGAKSFGKPENKSHNSFVIIQTIKDSKGNILSKKESVEFYINSTAFDFIESVNRRKGKPRVAVERVNSRLWNKDQELAWLKKNFPNIPVKVLEDLRGIAGERLWGLFYNSIYIAENAAEGTGYWEAWRAIFDIYLTEEQRSAVLDEASKAFNIDRIRTDLIETELARNFMIYMQARQSNMPTTWLGKLGRNIKEFFERLFNLISYTKNQDKLTIDKLYRYGATGVFRNKKKVGKSKETKFRRIDTLVEDYGFTPTEVQDAINLGANLLNEALQEHLRRGGDHKALISKDKNLLLAENIPYSLVNTITEYYENLPENRQDELLDDFSRFYDALLGPEGTDTSGPLYYELQREMSKYGYIITDKVDLKENELEEVNEESNAREDWSDNILKINPLTSLSTRLQLFLGGIPQVEWKNKVAEDIEDRIETKKGYLGLPRYYTTGYVYLQLQRVAGNSFSSKHMKSKIAQEAMNDPMFAKIKSELDADPIKYTELYVAVGQKIKPKFVSVIQDNKGLSVVLTNRNTLKSQITEDLIAGFLNSGKAFDKKGNFNTELGRDLLSRNIQILDDVKKYFSDLGIVLDAAFYERLEPTQIGQLKSLLNGDHPKYKAIFTNFIQSYVDGKDAVNENPEAFSKLANIIEDAYEQQSQNMHKNPSGGQVYEWIQSNYAGRLINRLKDKNEAIGLLESLMQDETYKNLPLLQKIYQSYTGKSIPGSDLQIHGKFNTDGLNFSILAELKQKGRSKGMEYKDMTAKQVYLSMLAMYDASPTKGTISIPLPVHSDSGVMTYLEIPNTTKELGELSEGFLLEDGTRGVLSELTDIAYIDFLRSINKIGVKNREDFDSKKKLGKKFVYFDNLNSSYNEIKKLHDEGGFKAIESLLQKGVQDKVNSLVESNIEELKTLSIIKEYPSIGKLEFVEDIPKGKNPENFMKHYVANHMLYSSQIGIMMNGDIGFYKSITDYYKRAKQVWSPGLNIDTNAVWTDEATNTEHKVRPTYNVKYLKDNETAFQFDEIKANLIKLFGEKKGTELANKYKKVNETDAQSYSDLFKYREEQMGLGRWNQDKQAAYNRLMRGESNRFDIDVIFNASKPFYYSQHMPDDQSQSVVPVQNKDSQYYLIPSPIFTKPESDLYNPKYVEMLRDMGYKFDEAGNIIEFDEAGRYAGKYTDKFTFESAVKVGLYGQSENISDAKTHKFNNSDWRLQMETPPHFIDDRVMFATQVRAHMLNNLDQEYTLDEPYNGKRVYTGEELLKLYNDIVIKDLQEAYADIASKFKNFDDLLQLLKEEVISRGLGMNYLEALEINPITGKTNIPLWHPSHIYRIESMLNSLFTNRVVKQKLNQGVTYINLSSYGFKNKPKLKFNTDGSLSHVEAYAPIHSEELLLHTDENGFIDIKTIESIDPKLLGGMVWRIPNEEKYSTFKIKIIGFLPKEMGGVIVMPPEVTTIAGLDFDIDKVPGFFYNIKRRFDWTKLEKTLRKHYTPKGTTNRALDLIYLDFKSFEEFKKNFNPKDRNHVQFMNMINDLPKKELEKVSKLNVGNIGDTSKAKRDNLKMLMMRAVMSSKEATKAFLNPGGYDNLTNNNKDIVIPKRTDTTAKVVTDSETGEKTIIDDVNPINPVTQATISGRMLEGKALIGIFANAVKAHIFFQKAETLKLIKGFNFNNKQFNTLNKSTAIERVDKIKAKEPKINDVISYKGNNVIVLEKREDRYIVAFESSYKDDPEDAARLNLTSDELLVTEVPAESLISRNIAEPLAASVDNGKDPQLGYSNINSYTVDVAVGMLLAGVDLLTVQAFLSQPEIIAYSNFYFQNGATFQAERKAEKVFGIPNKVLFNKYTPVNLNQEQLIAHIGSKSFNKEILNAFLTYKKIAKPINNLVLAMKVGEGGLGPTDSHNITKLDQLNPNQFKDIEGATELLELKETKLAGDPEVIELFQTYDSIFRVLSKFRLYPNMINSIIGRGREDINKLGLPDRNAGLFRTNRRQLLDYKPDGWLTPEEIEFANMDFLTYLYWKTQDYRKDLANTLPDKLQQFKDANPNSEYNVFLSRLKITRPDKLTKAQYIYFNGQSVDQDLIRYTWEQMLYSDDPEVKQLAIDLIDYSMMLNGFRITPGSFSNYLPMAYYKDFKQLKAMDKLEELMKASEEIEDEMTSYNFTDQFIKNHFRSLSYIPSIRNEKGDSNILELKIEKGEPYKVALNSQEFKGRSGDWVKYIKYYGKYDKENQRQPAYLFKLDVASTEDTGIYKRVEEMGTYMPGYGKMFTEYNETPNTEFNLNKLPDWMEAIYEENFNTIFNTSNPQEEEFTPYTEVEPERLALPSPDDVANRIGAEKNCK